jgi:hypothetical protein
MCVCIIKLHIVLAAVPVEEVSQQHEIWGFHSSDDDDDDADADNLLRFGST